MNINQLITRADIPNLTTMFGNIGNSWNNPLPNDLYIRNVAKDILRVAPQIGNVGAGLDLLHSYTLPAGSLKANNDIVRVRYGGKWAANDTDKRIVIDFGGTSFETGGGLDFDGAVGFWVDAQIYRLGSTIIRVNHGYISNSLFADSADAVDTFNAGGLVVSRDTLMNPLAGSLDLDEDDVDLEFFGEGAATDDVVLNTVVISLTRA